MRGAIALILGVCAAGDVFAAGVHMANGIKIGEVTHDSAIVWTRLTPTPQRNANGAPFPKEGGLPEGRSLAEMEGAAPGAPGEVRVLYWPWKWPEEKRATAWKPVAEDADFTRQFQLEGLKPALDYELRIEGRSPGAKDAECLVEGSFNTAPAPDDARPVCFTVVTGQDYHNREEPDKGHKIYPRMARLEPDFFVHTGDIVYYDRPAPDATNVALARFKWNRIYAMPYQRDFHNHVASYFIKDDHDTLKDDSWPGQQYGDLTFEQGLDIFREQVPMGEKTYRTFRWGKDLQIWLLEGRDFRSPNTMPDGPDKTIWGEEQKQWFFDTVEASDATFKVLISPTPIVGPDRPAKNDNHANAGFSHEGEELRRFIGQQKNMFVVCGDRHWQYASVDPKTGVREFASGPTNDAHSGGFSEDQRSPMHKYLRIGGGFLSAAVSREDGMPRIAFSHYDTAGKQQHEQVFLAE